MKTIRTIGILLLVMSFFIGCEFEIYSENTMEVNGAMGKIAYSDGSVSEYYDSTKTPIGIVIEVSDEGVAKIVSLTETSANWSTEEVVTNATSRTDGAANMKTIQAIEGWKTEYPAFKWCDDYTDASGNSNWYLPAIDELNQLYHVKSSVNAVIYKIIAGGGTATKLDTGYYWSSSQDDYRNAWFQGFSDGDQSLIKTYNPFSVRAVRAFSTIVNRINVVSTSHKTSYNAGDFLDVSGLIIKVTKSNGSIENVYVTSSMVSGFNSSNVGTQTLTITYGGCTTTFDVEVVENTNITAANVSSVIARLSPGTYTIKMTGKIDNNTLTDIKTAMSGNSNAKINLDLSDTTGLTSTGSGTSGSCAFWYCDNLISIILPDGLTSIGNDAFTGCNNLINVVIPESVTEIGHDAFKSCSKLINAEIPEGVTTINEQTFAYCSSLTSVTIPASVTYIDYSAFEDCSSLTTVNYRGTQEQWEQISIESDNTYLTNATINYNYTGSVLGKVTAIFVNSTSHKTSYKVGESLDVSGLTIEVTRDDGTIKTSNVTLSMVSGFNPLELGTQTLTITYGGCTTTFDVEVVGCIGSIAYSDGTISVDYDSTKTAIGIVIEATDGTATKIVSLTEVNNIEWSTETVNTNAMYDTDGVANLIAIQSIDDWEEKYPAFKWCDDYTDESGNSEWYLPAKDELNQLYEVKDTVNVAIDKITAGGGIATKLGTGWYWSSSEYYRGNAWGQRFRDGGQFNYVKYDTSTSVRAVRAFSMETTIVNRINVVSTSHKTSYYVGEPLDLSGLTIEVTRDDGTIKTSNVTLSMVSGFDSSVVGTQTLTITYGGCTTTFDVEVVENAISTLNITSTPSKTSYYVGDPLDLSGLEIEGVYLDGSTSTLTVTSDMVSGFDSSVVGTQTLTITYGGCTTTFDVEVVGGARKIGDIAYSDGSVSENYDNTKTPVGIVIDVSDGVTKIVSLTETKAVWSAEYVTTKATSATDGVANMTAIQAIEGWKTKYPAFKWCDDYTDASGNSQWYLPAKNELNQLYTVKKYVNAAIDKIIAGGGIATKLDTGYYWSSSEDYSVNVVWYQNFSDGSQCCSYYKDNSFSVRAVRAF